MYFRRMSSYAQKCDVVNAFEEVVRWEHGWRCFKRIDAEWL